MDTENITVNDQSYPDGEVPTSTGPPADPSLGDHRSVHLLRTDLTLLIGRAQLVHRRLNGQDELQPELRDALAALQRAAEHLLRLAETLPPAAPRQAANPPPSHPSANGDT